MVRCPPLREGEKCEFILELQAGLICLVVVLVNIYLRPFPLLARVAAWQVTGVTGEETEAA